MPFRRGSAPLRNVPRRRAWIRRAWATGAVIAAALSLVTPRAFASEVTTVDVLIHDRARVTGPHLVVALATAERSFRTAGVRLVWRNVTDAQEHAPQLTIVLSSQVDTQLKASLGASHIGVFLRAAQRAYIMYDRVVVLGRRYDADVATVLGRAIAHEIGHLLLGDRHSASGVMAAQLTPAGLLDEPFSPAERAYIRAHTSTLPVPSVPRLAGNVPTAIESCRRSTAHIDLATPFDDNNGFSFPR